MSTKEDILFQKKLNNSAMSVKDRINFIRLTDNNQIGIVKLKLFFNFNHLDKEVISELNFYPTIYINKYKICDEFIIDYLTQNSVSDSNINIIEKVIDNETNHYEYSILLNYNEVNSIEELENQIYDWVYLVDDQKIL